MRQPARPEVVAERSRDAVVLAEHDPGQDRAPFSRRPAGERLFDVRVQPVGDATDPAPPADEACVVAAQHDVDALPRQPRTLVEAGLGPARRDRLCAQLENCPLRGCALARQLEQDALPELQLAEALDLCRQTQCERRPADRARDDDARIRALSDPFGQEAAVERAFAERAPAESDERERHSGESDSPQVTLDDRCEPSAGRHRQENGLRRPEPDGRRETEARGRREERRPIRRDEASHGVTRSRSCSIRAGPMPGTSSRASTDLNGPWVVRQSTIFCAVTGPIPAAGRAAQPSLRQG